MKHTIPNKGIQPIHKAVINGLNFFKFFFCRVVHPISGRVLDMYTTEPGVQFYTSYNLGGQPGKGGIIYNRYGAFALEAQHYPDSPNQVNIKSLL